MAKKLDEPAKAQSENQQEFLTQSGLNVRDYILHPAENFTPPEALLLRGDTPILTVGSCSGVIGEAKAMKTSLVVGIVAAMLTGEALGFQRAEAFDKSLITFFDTEQGRSYGGMTLQKVLKLAGLPIDKESERLTYYSLREAATEQRLEIISNEILRLRPGLAVVDGLVDLVMDYNSPAENQKLWETLLNLSGQTGTHILSVLHVNPNSTKARGAAGTIMTQKVEQLMLCTKRGGTTSVKSQVSRQKPFDTFSFNLTGDEALPTLCASVQQGGDSLSLSLGFARQALAEGARASYSDLSKQLTQMSGKSERTGRNWVKNLEDKGYLTKGEDGLYRLSDPEKEGEEVDYED